MPAFSKGVREREGGNLGKEFAFSGVHPFLKELRLPQKQIFVSYEKKIGRDIPKHLKVPNSLSICGDVNPCA